MTHQPLATAPPVFDAARYKQTTREQWQAAAEAWHRWGPTLSRWLGPATERMLDLARLAPGQYVVDVAAGAGDQTLAIARRLGPSGHVLATDIAPDILEFARRAAAEAGLRNVETRTMDGEELDLPEASVDAVVSRVGLIYFPDRQRALTGMFRVLRPGGRVAAMVYSTADKNPFFSIPVSIIRQRAELPPPAPGQPGPFSLGGPGVLEDAYRRAGFTDVEVHAVPAPLRLASAAECVRFERESFGALHQMMADLSPAQQASVWGEIEGELKAFEGRDGFAGPCEMLIGVGRR